MRISRVYLLLFLVTITFLLGEISYRSYLYFYQNSISSFFQTFHAITTADKHLGYRLKPGYNNGNESINNLGFRGKNFSKIKSPSTFRIVALGGSTTYGTGVSNDDTYVVRLENILAQSIANIEVINGGVSGYHTFHHLLRMPEIISLKPDLILLYSGWNDYGVALVQGSKYVKNTTQGSGVLYNPDTLSKWQRFFVKLTAYSVQLRVLKDLYIKAAWHKAESQRGAFSLPTEHGMPSNDRIQAYHTNLAQLIPYEVIASNYQSNLEEIILKAQKENIPVVMATMPYILRQKHVKTDYENLLKLWSKNDNSYWHWLPYAKWQQLMIQVERKIAQKYNIQLIETAMEFDKLPFEARLPLFNDFIHLSKEGNLKLSKIMAEALIKPIDDIKVNSRNVN